MEAEITRKDPILEFRLNMSPQQSGPYPNFNGEKNLSAAAAKHQR